MIFKRRQIRTVEDEMRGSKNFSEFWRYCKPIIERLDQKLPDPNFVPRIEEQVEANSICEINFGMNLRRTLTVVVNGLLRSSIDISLNSFSQHDHYFAAFGITDRIIFYSKEKEFHLTLIPKEKMEGVMLVRFAEDLPGMEFYYDDSRKGGTILL